MAMDEQVKPRTSPKEVFLHLLSMITLYVSAGSLITLFFQYINILVPDLLFPEEGNFDAYRGPLRFAISSLIVVFPVFIGVSRLLGKGYRMDAARREMRLRKWLVYFTLFAAALIIIGDLVYLLNRFLEGEATPRFILKALSFMGVAGAIFWYYLADVRRAGPPQNERRIAWIASAVVFAAVVGGFFLAGSPQSERLRKFDDERVSHLRDIQGRIASYWQSKNKLPEQLADLRDEVGEYKPSVDPETRAPYDYRAVSPKTFELCAVFNLPSRTAGAVSREAPYPVSAPIVPQGPLVGGDQWKHAAGRACFTRTIDPDFYPPRTPKGAQSP